MIALWLRITCKTLGENYTIMEHKRITTLELVERGYKPDVIDEWFAYIE